MHTYTRSETDGENSEAHVTERARYILHSFHVCFSIIEFSLYYSPSIWPGYWTVTLLLL